MDELIRGLQAGRPEAWERLVREFGDRIFRFVKRLAGGRHAEDLTQEVFLRVFRSVGAWRPTGRFESWLFTIANNLVIDQARKRRPEAPMSELDAEMTGERFVSAGDAPPERAEQDERRRAILKAVERLPVDQRQVFLLREEGGLTFREIADLAGCPLNTALGRMHYAMENLRRTVNAHGMR